MGRRSIEFQNYRNIGVSKNGKFSDNDDNKFYLNKSLKKEDIGELIILIGENNVGKSNILDGIAAIKWSESAEDAPLKESDKPDFLYHENTKPEIKLVYDDVDGKSFCLRYFLDDEGKAQFQTNIELEEKVVEVTNPKRQLSEEVISAIKSEFEDKFKYENYIVNYCRRFPNKTYAKDFAAIKKAYDDIMAKPESIDVDKLNDEYARLQKLMENFVPEYNRNMPSKIKLPTFIDLDIKIKELAAKESLQAAESALKEKYGISLVPQIVYYKEEEIKDDDLKTTPNAIKDSKFFDSLFKSIGESIEFVTKAYKKAEINPAYNGDYEDSINEKLEDVINARFNELYFQGKPTQKYSFSIRLEKEQISLGIRKNGHVVLLSRQSTGFKWFFNFFFNFLYAADLQAGDIVLMDEPDAHLAIPARRELRRFIKGFAKSSGITFIAATQNPDLVDPDFLDELRIVRQKKGEGKIGAEIENRFYVIGEDADDTINEILVAFGVHHRDIITNPNSKVIYVEGPSDYNYLTAFKLLKDSEESEKSKKISLAFLPIGGVGLVEEQMKKRIGLLIRHRDAVVLTDSDERGEKFKKIWEADADAKDNLAVLQLKEFDASFKEIEDLFSEGDKNKYKLNPEKGSKDAPSALFKRKVFNFIHEINEIKKIKDPEKKKRAIDNLVDAKTKENFYNLLEYIINKSGEKENSV